MLYWSNEMKNRKEHKEDIKKGKITMALARLNAQERIEIDFQHIKKLANNENFNNTLKREAVVINSTHKAIYHMEHEVMQQGFAKC